MDSIWIEYGWTLLILIGLEGILSADNALVIAVIAKHLPDEQKKRAINYGILIAFVVRFAAIFLISFLANVWQVQAIGAAYLIYLSVNHIYKRYFRTSEKNKQARTNEKQSGFISTIIKISISDIAFAIDSVLAAVALAITLPNTALPQIGGMDGGQFVVIVIATIAGLILIKFAASWFIKLLDKRPGLETVAFLIVGWVGVKLAVITMSHESVGLLHESFAHSSVWTTTFWTVLISIVVVGWFLSGKRPAKENV